MEWSKRHGYYVVLQRGLALILIVVASFSCSSWRWSRWPGGHSLSSPLPSSVKRFKAARSGESRQGERQASSSGRALAARQSHLLPPCLPALASARLEGSRPWRERGGGRRPARRGGGAGGFAALAPCSLPPARDCWRWAASG